MKTTVATQNTFSETRNTASLLLRVSIFADLFRCGPACHGIGSAGRQPSL